jgi:hypothetical protein
MKKKTPILFISIISIIFLFLFVYGQGRPGFGNTHSAASCHQNTLGYTISTNATSPLSVNQSSTIYFSINATGPDLFIQAHPDASDNALFSILPTTDKINDSSPYDNDPSSDMSVVFRVTAPSDEGYYYIFIIAGESGSSRPPFAFLEIEVSVGGAPAPGFDIWGAIFNHLGLYLGIPALGLVSLATVLVLINENKFVKTHGILSGAAWGLTLINVIAAVVKIPVNVWSEAYPLIIHLPHIILGAIGLFTGLLSMLFGIAAERRPAKLTGYITLACWWGAFLLGYFLNSNLLLI